MYTVKSSDLDKSAEYSMRDFSQRSIINTFNTLVSKSELNKEVPVRRFIRHPSDIPISFSTYCENLHLSKQKNNLKDIGLGGVCFTSDKEIEIGLLINIEIPVDSPPFCAQGKVAWCLPQKNQFAIGVEFDDSSTQYSIRMIEQVCHIEHYRKEVWRKEQRELSAEAAAQEWIQKFASSFPKN